MPTKQTKFRDNDNDPASSRVPNSIPGDPLAPPGRAAAQAAQGRASDQARPTVSPGDLVLWLPLADVKIVSKYVALPSWAAAVTQFHGVK